MTKINRITIHGFKSFAHKTDVPFDNKFNCILGPNGSGKSNLSESICFVLGRLSAKSMRAEKAANLIFNGGKSKQPASKAYVEIAFDNSNNIFPSKEKEIVINRSISKKGGSAYFINGKKRTRTEVLDTLASAKINPDGYNIIFQGDITRFVDMSPLQRRKVIEEISDVSLYEEKKNKAMLELNKVEEKLNNATVILKERKTYLRELKKDRDQALKFKDLKDKIDSYRATNIHYQILERSKIKDKYDAEVSKQQKLINELEQQVATLREKTSSYQEEISSINQEIEKKGEASQVKAHKEIEDLKVSVISDKTRVSTLKDEINKIKQRKDQFAQEIKELQGKSSSHVQQQKELEKTITRSKKELQEVEAKIAQFKKKHNIESSNELDKEIDEKDKVIESKQEQIQEVRKEQQELLREKDRIEYQLQSLDERIAKVKEVEKENKEQIKVLQNIKNNFKDATLRLSKCLDNDSSFASQLSHARKKMVSLQEQHAQLNAKTLSFQAGLSANKAVKSILDNKKKFSGVYGTVAELGQVKKKYATALEAAAGGRMQQIIVEDDKTAADCIKFLKNNKLGSASFIPLNKIRYQDISSGDKALLKQAGVHDFALNLVSYNSKYKKAFAYVFSNSLVVDDIQAARKVGVGKIKMTTLDGDRVEVSGVMQGGFRRKSTLGFREKDSFEGLEKLDGEISEIQGIIANIEVKREANQEEISGLRNKKAEWEAEMIKLEKTLHLDTGDLEATSTLKKDLTSKLKEVDNSLAEVQKQVASINKELAQLKSKKQILRSKVNELRNPRLLAQLSAFEDARQNCREQILKKEGELKNSTTQREQLLLPEVLKIEEIVKQHDKEEKQFLEEIKQLTEQFTKNEKELRQKEEASKVFYSKYKELFNQREGLNNNINDANNKIEQAREKVRSAEREVNLVSLKNAEIKAKLAGLEEEFARYKDAKLLKDMSSDELTKNISKFEVMLAQMSAVNMKALEVYEQVEKEYTNLVDKKESLLKEKTDVLTLMNEIETKKKEHFMKTFNQTNENFSRIFGSLFSKGKAYLQLENKDNPFEDGLSIKVKLSGNRFMDIKSLSGGEKTLTALSFIFSVQEYQPASFYILDEIDAALDKHNAELLAKLIRNYSDNAQYIVISHNDALISEADTLFGVSMNNNVSKVTSLKI